MFTGKTNIVAGFLFLAVFMLYRFILIFLRDFAPGKEQWIAEYAIGKHFESRLAHVHGGLFALINIAAGLVLVHLPISSGTRWVSGLTLLGMLMPLGILAEVLIGAPPLFVLIGGVSMVAAMIWAGIKVWKTKITK